LQRRRRKLVVVVSISRRMAMEMHLPCSEVSSMVTMMIVCFVLMVVDMEMNRRAALVLDACSVDWMYHQRKAVFNPS